MRTFIKTLPILLVLAAVVGGPIAAEATPLIPPVIRDRVILGQGSLNSADAYEITKKGDYLYVATNEGLETVEISSSGGYNVLSHVDSVDLGHKANGVDTEGSYLYIANWSQYQSVKTYSIATQNNPTSSSSNNSTYHTWHSNVINGALYVAEGVSGPGGIRVYDLASPGSPSYTQTMSPTQYQNTHISNTTGANNYIYWGRGRWLYIYSASDPDNPSYVTRRDLTAHIQYVKVYDGYLYIACREDSTFGPGDGGIYVYSLANPAQPSNVKGGTNVSWQSSGVYHFHIQGNYMAIASGRWIRMLDVSDPTNLKRYSSMDPISIVWDDDGDSNAESPTDLPNYTGPDHMDGYVNCITGSGDYIYAGTTETGFYNGNETYFGSRVYAIQISEGEGDEISEVSVKNFVAASGSQTISLSWTNPNIAEFTGTMIRYKTTGYPTSTTDGTLLIDKSGTAGANDSTTHSSLTNGTTYYYTAWAHDSTPTYSMDQFAAATPTASTCYTENFTYADGDLNGKGSWSGSATDQIDVVSNTIKINGGTTTYDSAQTVTCGDNGDGIIQVSVKVQSGAGDTNMWNLYLDDTNGLNMARWYGAGTSARGRIGSTGIVTAPQTLTGGWDDLVVRIDPYARTSEFFFNGTSIGVLDYSSTGADNTLGKILFQRNDNSAAVGHYLSFDTLIVGGTVSLPPGQSSSPSPADLATGVSNTTDLSWVAGPGATSHDVYFGTTSPGTSQGNQSGTTYDTGTMSNGTTYYWRIDEKNATGTTTGAVWSFTTLAVPGSAGSPSPADSATAVAPNATLSWTAATDATSYDVYFGTDSTPDSTELIGNQAGTTYDPGGISYDTTYYWRIDAKNSAGTTTGTVWSFATESAPSVAEVNVKAAYGYTIDGDETDWTLTSWTTLSRGGQDENGDIALTGYDSGTNYYAGYGTGLVLPTSATDHTAKVYMSHDSSYLYFLVRCDDDDIQTSSGSTGDNWRNDCVEFYIDPSDNGGSSAMSNSTSDIQLVIDAANRQNVYVTTSGYKTQVLAGVTSAVSTDANGWWLEVKIDKTVLDADIPDSGTFGIDFNFRDNDSDNSSSLSTVYCWSDTEQSGAFPSKIPDRWGDAVLDALPNAPGAATSPSPATTATGVSINTDLTWTVGTGVVDSHDVYFGTDSTPDSTEFQGNQVATTFGTGGTDPNTTYYWRIDEVNAGGTTTGTVWSFTTLPLPGSASSPSPSDSATDVLVTSVLSWTAGSNTDSHDVHFGTTDPPTLIGGQTGTTYDPGTLTAGETYYWQVDEINSSGTAVGSIWSFTAELDGVSVDLGVTDVEDDLANVINVGDGDTVGATAGGVDCRQNLDSTSDFYFYFDVDDTWSYQGDNSNVYVRVEYYDTGSGILRLQYDSPGAETTDKYKVAGTTTLTNSNTWKTYAWHLTDAYFGNRENAGADFRVFGGTNTTFYLNVVEVYSTTINVNPVADISATPTSGSASLAVSFDGTGSSDPDGTISTYQWDFDNNGTIDSTASAPNHTYTVADVYTCKLIVTDDDGLDAATTAEITVTGGCAVIISNLNRYSEVTYSDGSDVYNDRSYTISTLPAYLDGVQGIRTANDDKNQTSSSWITFDIDHATDVYIAYDDRTSPTPNWMSSYSDTGDNVSISAGATYDLHVKTFSSGSVTLGANKATGAGGIWSNYFVFILPNCDTQIAFDEFASNADGWTTGTWRAGPYGYGTMAFVSATGNSAGSMKSMGSGGTNNTDSCTREGGSIEKTISTLGYEDIEVIYDVKFDTDQTNNTVNANCSSTILEGDGHDKLVVYYSSNGGSTWTLAEEVVAADVSDSTWLTRTVDLSAVTALDDNASFALKFVFQFNTESDKARLDNIEVRGLEQ